MILFLISQENFYYLSMLTRNLVKQDSFQGTVSGNKHIFYLKKTFSRRPHEDVRLRKASCMFCLNRKLVFHKKILIS